MLPLHRLIKAQKMTQEQVNLKKNRLSSVGEIGHAYLTLFGGTKRIIPDPATFEVLHATFVENRNDALSASQLDSS